jgi:hypothetical protein
VPKATVKVQIETPYSPSKVDWKIKIGTAVVASGIASGNPSEEFVELDAQTLYKFVIVDRNSVKDTYYEIWRGGNVLIDGDCNCRKDVQNFQL